MKPAGVHHVAICVADAQKGLAFYRDVLGMTQLPRPDLGPGCWLDAGGQQVHLMESDTQPLGANHFAIRVDDIDAAFNDLQEQGVEVHRIPLPPASTGQLPSKQLPPGWRRSLKASTSARTAAATPLSGHESGRELTGS